jgi:short-chain Z-isoprenyl diphosphate synthase
VRGLRDFHPLETLAYAYYERRLERQVTHGPLPHHIGMILDGNRRYAREQGSPDLLAGYQRGADKIEEVLAWCDRLDIPVVTLWALSVDNLHRHQDDLAPLYTVIEGKIRELVDPPPGLRRRRLHFIGRMDLLPDSTRVTAEDAEERTRSVEGHVLNIAIGYGGREEIADAVKKMFAERMMSGHPEESWLADVTPEAISRHMYMCDYPDPDLIIRTSGEVRLSGFLLWQSAYSEFYFCDAYWPAFRKIDFLRAIRAYQQRQRRFGL